MSSRVVRGMFSVVGTLTLVSVVACGAASSAPPPSSATSGTSPHSAAAEQAVLMKVVVQAADVPAGISVGLYQGGDQVVGQVTLDYCGATFPSEALRVARRQVGVVSANAEVFSTEAVLYSSPAAETQAMSELRAAVSHCPSGFVQGHVAGEPPLKTSFGPSPDAQWPQSAGVARYAIDVTAADQAGDTEHEIAVFLSRGSLLLALYFHTPDAEPQIAGQATPGGVTAVFTQRVLALSAADVGL